DSSVSIGLREHAANTLAGANQKKTHEQLLAALPVVSAKLQTTIAAGLALSKEGADKLLDAVAGGKASARLLQDPVVRQRLQTAKPDNLAARLKKLTAGLPSPDAKLQALMVKRSKAYTKVKRDPKKGLKVYEKHCANCHQIGGKGAKVGPQLDGI